MVVASTPCAIKNALTASALLADKTLFFCTSPVESAYPAISMPLWLVCKINSLNCINESWLAFDK